MLNSIHTRILGNFLSIMFSGYDLLISGDPIQFIQASDIRFVFVIFITRAIMFTNGAAKTSQ